MSDLERPTLKADFDNMPQETYAGLGYPVHRFADFIPVADDKDQYILRQSIAEVGLLEPIMLYQGAILDGRHRYKACQMVGVEPHFQEFAGTDDETALQFVLAKNVARRQLTTIQKLTLREKIKPEIERLKAEALQRMLAGQPSTSLAEAAPGRVDEQVSNIIGLSRETQRQYDRVQEIAAEQPAAQDFLNEMLAGNIGVEKAYKQATAVSKSDMLDQVAKAQAGPTPEKQRAELIAVIRKCRDLLVPYDWTILTESAFVTELDELWDWVNDAYRYTN